MVSSELVFEPVTAPPRADGLTWTTIAERLRSNPGQWAKVMHAVTDNAARQAAWQIRKGQKAAFRPHGHFDSTVSGSDVYACFDPATAHLRINEDASKAAS